MGAKDSEGQQPYDVPRHVHDVVPPPPRVHDGALLSSHVRADAQLLIVPTLVETQHGLKVDSCAAQLPHVHDDALLSSHARALFRCTGSVTAALLLYSEVRLRALAHWRLS